MRPSVVPLGARKPVPPAHEAAGPPPWHRRRWLSTALGALLAVVLFEVVVGWFTTGAAASWEPIERDSPRDPVHERWIYYEGIALSRYSPAHSRLTGAPWIDGAPVGVIVGDSHVEAAQVPDHQTMGAVAERTLRGRGTPVNLRQYGRPGVSAPALLQEAPAILRRWNPAWVVAVVADGDLDSNPLVGRTRFVVRGDGSYTLQRDPAPPPPGGIAGVWRRLYTDLVGISGLGYATLRRLHRSRVGPIRPDVPLRRGDRGYEIRRLVPAVTVHALHDAYGDRLLVVYLPHVGATPAEDYHHAEERLLDACRVQQVRCVSMRPAFLRARERDHRLTRGFHNTPPAFGHLNEEGHRLVGEAIATAVAR